MTGPPAQPRSSTGLDENLAAALSYVGGAVTGVLFLALEQRSAVVRFHARQSAITFLVLAVVYLLIHSLPVVGRFLAFFVLMGIIVLWVFLMVKAVRGQRYKLPYIGDWAEEKQ